MDCDPRMWVMALLRLLVGVALLLAAAALVRDLTSGEAPAAMATDVSRGQPARKGAARRLLFLVPVIASIAVGVVLASA